MPQVRLAKRRFDVPGRLIPNPTDGLRARCVWLLPEEAMHWHTTGAREELILVLEGQVRVETKPPRGRAKAMQACSGQSVFLPKGTAHRIVNLSRKSASYVYVTGQAASK